MPNLSSINIFSPLAFFIRPSPSYASLIEYNAWGQDNSYRGRGPNITRHNYCWFTRIAHSFYQEYKNVYITSYTYINSWREHEKVHDIIIS